jgi:hypothetical protein
MLSDPAILDRVFNARRGDFPAQLAKRLLTITFPAKDRAQYQRLSRKAQDGTLTRAERARLEDYVNVNDLLMILKAKAEISLRRKNSAA